MSGIFGGGSTPTPQPLPAAPDTTLADQQAQADAAAEAQAATNARGRASTIVGGMQIAQDQQSARRAARTLGTP